MDQIPDAPTANSWFSWVCRRKSELVLAASAMAVALIGFGWTLNGHFLGDDFGYVGRFFELPLAQWTRLFVESWAGPIWGFELRELRPITALSFLIDARIWGGEAFGFRLTNLLLHAIASVMVGWLAWRAAGRELTCGIAAVVLFGLHPVHPEAVQWITGRVDVLATTFYLAGFVTFVRYREHNGGGWLAGAVAGWYALAAFSKEFGLTLPMMCLAADVLWLTPASGWREWRRWLPYAWCIVVVAIYFVCRRTAFRADGLGIAIPDFASMQFHAQHAQRQLVYFSHLFPPADRWLGEGSPILTGHVVRTFGWISGIALGLVAFWRFGALWRPTEERRGLVFFALGWYLIATVPLVITYISARHLYLASAGVCVAAALVLHGVLRHRTRVAAATLALAALFGQRLSTTMKPWHDAAVVSGEIAGELARLEPHLQRGGALLVDVPEITRGAYVWTWAVPFVLRPPFSARHLDQGMVVLESRGLYVDWERWHQQPGVEDLADVRGRCWILQKRGDEPVRGILASPERIRPAAEKFAAAKLVEFPHENWRQLIHDLTAP